MFFFLSPLYHRQLIAELRLRGAVAGGLTATQIEPWGLDYPVFCDSGNAHLVSLFIHVVAAPIQ